MKLGRELVELDGDLIVGNDCDCLKGNDVVAMQSLSIDAMVRTWPLKPGGGGGTIQKRRF